MTTDGTVTEYPAPTADPFLTDITSACGSLWISQGEEDGSDSALLQVTTAGVFTTYTAGLPADSSPDGVALGPDDDVWFTLQADPGRVGHIGAGCAAGPTTTTTGPSTGAAGPGRATPASAVAATPRFTG
jgi:hypothetical protein